MKKDFKLNKLIKEGINCIVVRTLAKKSKKLFIIKKHNINKTNNINESCAMCEAINKWFGAMLK